jgi:flagellar motor protein MotB
MSQINFLKRKRSFPFKSTFIGVLVIGMAFSALKKHRVAKPLVVSSSIPTFLQAPIFSHMDQLENELKTRKIAEKAVAWARTGPNGSGVEITLPSDSLFQMGSAAFDSKFELELKDFIHSIADKNEDLRVTIESHTDDTPVVKHHKIYKSNWELSAARAGAVAGVFQESSFPKLDLEAIGFADSRPLSSDRNQNRRIVLRFTDKTRGGS